MSNISNNTPYITPTLISVNVYYCRNQLLNVRGAIYRKMYAITVAPKPYQNKNLFLGTRDGRTPALPYLSYFLTGRIIPSVSTPPTSPLATARLHGYLEKQSVKPFLVLVHLPAQFPGEK